MPISGSGPRGSAGVSRRFARCRTWALFAVGLFGFAVSGASCGGDSGFPGEPSDSTKVNSISINGGSFELEVGTRKSMSATVKDNHGDTLTVPLVWRSSVESVATFDANGRLTAVDTGVTTVTATSLGITSAPIAVHVIWLGAANIATFQWTPPASATPSALVYDSVRVRVTNRFGAPVPGAQVKFTVTAGGGVVSVTKTTTGPTGVAATRWTLGSALGVNTLTATVVNDDDQLVARVVDNPIKFSITSYKALSVVDGNAQTAQLLEPLPVAPSILLVDSAGKPRVGIPVTFVATSGGSVASPTVSTGANGVASPGIWTLGDIPGDQMLIARVEAAEIRLHATGTGTPIHYTPASVVAGGFSSCGIETDQLVSCWGQQPSVGNGGSTPVSVPTPTSGALHFKWLAGGITVISQNVFSGHFCGVTVESSVYCWGVNPIVNGSGTLSSLDKPTRLASQLSWSQISPGSKHACGLTSEQTAYCFGSNLNGQLGNRSTDTSFTATPSEVYGGFKFASISAGTSHACGVTVDHAGLCWGRNQFSQLGDATSNDRNSPTAVSGGIAFQTIGAGDVWTCGLSTAGKVYCWGAVEGLTQMNTPHLYTSAPVFTSLSVGVAHACALTGDGTPYCWGNNQFGQLGDSTLVARTEPTLVAGGFKFKSISAGALHTCAQTLDGSVVCWGANTNGELGAKPSVSGPLRLVPRYIVLGVTP